METKIQENFYEPPFAVSDAGNNGKSNDTINEVLSLDQKIGGNACNELLSIFKNQSGSLERFITFYKNVGEFGNF